MFVDYKRSQTERSGGRPGTLRRAVVRLSRLAAVAPPRSPRARTCIRCGVRITTHPEVSRSHEARSPDSRLKSSARSTKARSPDARSHTEHRTKLRHPSRHQPRTRRSAAPPSPFIGEPHRPSSPPIPEPSSSFGDPLAQAGQPRFASPGLSTQGRHQTAAPGRAPAPHASPCENRRQPDTPRSRSFRISQGCPSRSLRANRAACDRHRVDRVVATSLHASRRREAAGSP